MKTCFCLLYTNTESEHTSQPSSTSLFADVQHHLVESLPLGQKPRHPGAAVPGGDERLPRGQGARQRRHCEDAVPEGCHQRDATVRGKYPVEISVSWKDSTLLGLAFVSNAAAEQQ